MIANKSYLNRMLSGGRMTKTTYRGFSGGGPKKPAISNKETEFDIIFVGKQP